MDEKTQRPVIGKDGKPVTKEVEVTVPAYKVVTVFDINVKSSIMLITSLKSYIYRLLRRYVLYIIF